MPMDFHEMQKQMREMQKKINEAEEDLRERIVEGTAGGGMIKVKVNGMEELVQVELQPEVLRGGDKAMVEDLILTAVNEGLAKARSLREKEMQRIAGGGGLSSLFRK